MVNRANNIIKIISNIPIDRTINANTERSIEISIDELDSNRGNRRNVVNRIAISPIFYANGMINIGATKLKIKQYYLSTTTKTIEIDIGGAPRGRP